MNLRYERAVPVVVLVPLLALALLRGLPAGAGELAEPEPSPTIVSSGDANDTADNSDTTAKDDDDKRSRPRLRRPHGRRQLNDTFGRRCNRRANDARTWFPSAWGRKKGGYVYYHSKLGRKIGRQVIRRVNNKPKAVDYGVWGYACRMKTGGTGWSVHSWGVAVDTNTLRNPYGRTYWNGRGSNGRRYGRFLPRVWMDRNFYWGLNFNDPMHFQYVTGY